MKRVVPWFFVFLATLSFGLTILASEFNRQALDSVVFLCAEVDLPDGEPAVITGTGFFIGADGQAPQYVVTNQHVVDDFLQTVNGVLWVVYDMEQSEQATVVLCDEKKDLAVLKIAAPTPLRKPAIFRSTSDELVGTSVYAIGYPAVADQTVRAKSLFGKQDATVTGGLINRILTEEDTQRRLLQIDVSIREGNSGGPLVDASGAVLGVNTMGSRVDNNLNYAVSADDVLDLLRRNDIRYTLADEIRRSTASKPSQIDSSVVAQARIRGVRPSLTMITFGASVLVILLGALLLARKRKKTSGVPLCPGVRSHAHQHAGMWFPLGKNGLVVGRSTSCEIVFAADSGGVSARHCRITYDAACKQFWLTDLNSTYGTYLSDGRKLPSHVPYPLRPGESFRLGGPENILSVELE